MNGRDRYTFHAEFEREVDAFEPEGAMNEGLEQKL